MAHSFVRAAAPILCVATLGCSAASMISNEQELEIGRGVAEQVGTEYTLLPRNSPVTIWANELVQAMVPASASFRDPDEIGGYVVQVIDDDTLVNAFAVPGGFVYFATGIILESETCAELAGVVGHELAHVTQRHGTKGLAASNIAGMLSTAVLGEGLPASVAQATWSFLESTTFSRRDETEADKVGTEIMYRTGYNPYALADFFQTLDEASGSRPPQFLSSHPDPGNRADSIRSEIQSDYGNAVVRGQTQTYNCLGTSKSLEEIQALIR